MRKDVSNTVERDVYNYFVIYSFISEIVSETTTLETVNVFVSFIFKLTHTYMHWIDMFVIRIDNIYFTKQNHMIVLSRLTD